MKREAFAVNALSQSYWFRLLVGLSLAGGTAVAWVMVGWGVTLPLLSPWVLAVGGTLGLVGVAFWQYKLYRRQTKRLLFLLDAVENDDLSVHFNETGTSGNDRLVNAALNKMASILYNVKHETAQREKYYELILNVVNTGILVLGESGTVYQKNNETLRLLGMDVFTHVRQLERVSLKLMEAVAGCTPGDQFQVSFANERGGVTLSVRVAGIVIRNEPLRIIALSDINRELDEKEVESWIRLIRVLTHEIMNAVTPITSLSDTLLTLLDTDEGREASPRREEEVRSGLQAICDTGKGLLSFVEMYRKFSHIPTPVPVLFYVKGFVERMVRLVGNQYAEPGIRFEQDIHPDDLIVYADENLVSQVVINILKNAVQAMEPLGLGQGRIRIRAYSNEAEAVVIEIANNGPVIPAEIAEQIFVPFFTTKKEGSGIGLSLSRQIMQMSGGSLTLRPGAETTFVLTFR